MGRRSADLTFATRTNRAGPGEDAEYRYDYLLVAGRKAVTPV